MIISGCRKWVAFLSNLASAAKKQSFSRPGLMGLAECIASAACRVGTHDDINKASSKEDAFVDRVQPDVGSVSQNNKIILLDALRFVIESSKQHFNPNYRLGGLKYKSTAS